MQQIPKKELISQVYKELLHFVPIRKWAKNIKGNITKKLIEGGNSMIEKRTMEVQGGESPCRIRVRVKLHNDKNKLREMRDEQRKG